MITTAQEDYIDLHAYVPEHIPQYVTPISQAEPHLLGEFLVYTKRGHLIFVGYPLNDTSEENRLEETLEDRTGNSTLPSTRISSIRRLLLSARSIDRFHFAKIEKHVKAGRERALDERKLLF
jgi:hypothetical protein